MLYYCGECRVVMDLAPVASPPPLVVEPAFCPVCRDSRKLYLAVVGRIPPPGTVPPPADGLREGDRR